MFKPGEYDPDPYEPAQDGLPQRLLERIFALLKVVSFK